jgi:hypothetical protein
MALVEVRFHLESLTASTYAPPRRILVFDDFAALALNGDMVVANFVTDSFIWTVFKNV